MTHNYRHERYETQLKRLGTLTDVVFGLVIWRLFQLIPRPEGENPGTVIDVLTSDPRALLGLVIGVVIVIVYWTQNNKLFGHLDRTDSVHTTWGILQLFCLLLFLYAINVVVIYESAADTRLLESITAMLVGVPAYLGWRHAKREGKLISPKLSKEGADAISIAILAEPITAAITIPFAIFTPILWEASWFTYPLVAAVLTRRKDRI